MAKSMWRSIGAVMAGGFCAIFVIMLLELTGHLVFPPPQEIVERLTHNDKQVRDKALREYLPRAHLGALLTVPFAWITGTMAGAYLAGRIAKTQLLRHAIAVGFILMIGGAQTLYSLPHPPWMWGGLFAFPIGAYLGSHLALKDTPQTEEASSEDST